MQIGQGYLLIETNEKVDPESLIQRISERNTIGLNPKYIAGKYNRNIRDKEDVLTLKKKIKQDSLADTYICIPLISSAFIIPGLSTQPSTKHKLYFVDDKGNNCFDNSEWDVLSKPTIEELPQMLKIVYTNFKKFN